MCRLQCDERCLQDYHRACWKALKSARGLSVDKDCLATPCPTPDCSGLVSGAVIVREDGEEIRLANDQLVRRVRESLAAEAKQTEGSRIEAVATAAAGRRKRQIQRRKSDEAKVTEEPKKSQQVLFRYSVLKERFTLGKKMHPFL